MVQINEQELLKSKSKPSISNKLEIQLAHRFSSITNRRLWLGILNLFCMYWYQEKVLENTACIFANAKWLRGFFYLDFYCIDIDFPIFSNFTFKMTLRSFKMTFFAFKMTFFAYKMTKGVLLFGFLLYLYLLSILLYLENILYNL